MEQVVISVFLGVLLLGMTLYWALRGPENPRPKIRLPQAIHALNSLETQLLPRPIVERIFDRGDQDFVGRQQLPEIHRLFLQERTALAISWLKQTQSQISTLMRYHLRFARADAGLKPSMEFRIATEYFMFLMTSRALIMLIWLRGPFELGRAVGYAIRPASDLCQVSVAIFAKIQAPELAQTE